MGARDQMIVDQQNNNMFCGLSLTGRKRKMAGVRESTTTTTTTTTAEIYGGITTPPPESTVVVPNSLPWWADVINSHELAHLIRQQCDDKVLLIDCRSFIEFNQSNIINSINVCCNKIVKRRLQQNKLKILEYLSSTCHIEIDSAYTIVLYDGDSTDAGALPADNILTIIGSKCNQTFTRVRVLYGGFLEFQQHHPSLLETKTKTPHQQASASLSQPCMPVTNIGPTKILPFLFLGSMKDALNADLAKANGITYVLNVSMTCPKPSHIQDGHFLRIPVNDNYSEKLLPHFHEAFQFIDKVRESGGCVLVHCLAGVSRSPTLAIAYIMRTYHMVSEEAYRYVKEKRITISPNFNFLGQLLEYEQQMEKEGNSAFTGSKRRCIDDLRAELSTPSSPTTGPRMPKSISLDPTLLANGSRTAGVIGIKQNGSPTAALSKLRFEHCHTAGVNQTSHSPTTAFAKLRFGAAFSTADTLPLTPKSSAQVVNDEPEFMQCFTSNTIHQNKAGATPVSATSRSLGLQILNCNNSNNTEVASTGDVETCPSPSRTSRPMSLSLTKDGSATQKQQCDKSSDSNDATSATPQNAPSSDKALEDGDVATPVRSTFKQPESPLDTSVDVAASPTTHVQLRERSATVMNRPRPKSVALAQNSPRETSMPSPSTPTRDYLTSPHTVPSNLDMILKYSSSSSQECYNKSRSLEDSIHKAGGSKVCLVCTSVDSCICQDKIPALSLQAQSTGSISSAGSHNSLHGSLEIIKVV